MRRSRVVALLSASAFAAISSVSYADTSLMTTQSDWGGSTYAPNPPPAGQPQQSGWQGMGYYNSTAGTIVPYTGQDFSNVEYTTYSTDSSTTNGAANFDNAFATSSQVGTSWAGLTSPSGSMTIEDYNGGYDDVTSGEMSPENDQNTAFLNALGSGTVLAVDFTSSLGGTTLSTQSTTAPFSGYYEIGMGTYVNGTKSDTGEVSATQVFSAASPTKQAANAYGDDVGSFVVNNGTYFTAYLPYSGGLGAAAVVGNNSDSLQFYIYMNSSSEYGFLNPSDNLSATAVGNVTIDNLRTVSPTWATGGSASWTASDPVTGSWIGGDLPGGVQGGAVGASATLGNLESGAATTTLDETWTLGTLNFNTTLYQYTVTPGMGGSLIMSNGASPAQINDIAGGQASTNYMEYLAAPITLNSNTVVTVSRSTDTLQIGGTSNPVVSGTGSLTVAGSGTLLLYGPNTYSGGTIVNAGGNLIAGSQSSLPSDSSLQNNGHATVEGAGTVVLSSLTGTGTLTVGNGSAGTTVQLAASSGAATVGGLVVTANSTFDVNNNHVIISYGALANDPIASIQTLLQAGYNGGTWNGTGIMSTAAAATSASYGLGYADAADPGNPAGLSSGTIEIKYTLLGDVNLDGVVNGTDFGILAANFNKGVTRWDQGDFNFGPAVNGTDFGDLAKNFNKGASGASFGPSALSDPAIVAFAEANGLMADVPEPMSMGLLAMGAIGLMARRRRGSD